VPVKKISVISQAGDAWSFTAGQFAVDENGYLSLVDEGTVVARFSPAAWAGVYDEEAAG
jgi:hypothetical protein